MGKEYTIEQKSTYLKGCKNFKNRQLFIQHIKDNEMTDIEEYIYNLLESHIQELKQRFCFANDNKKYNESLFLKRWGQIINIGRTPLEESIKIPRMYEQQTIYSKTVLLKDITVINVLNTMFPGIRYERCFVGPLCEGNEYDSVGYEYAVSTPMEEDYK